MFLRWLTNIGKFCAPKSAPQGRRSCSHGGHRDFCAIVSLSVHSCRHNSLCSPPYLAVTKDVYDAKKEDSVFLGLVVAFVKGVQDAKKEDSVFVVWW